LIIADTSGLLALFNRREPEHAQVRRLVAGLDAPMVVSPYVLAELDYLVATHVGVSAELDVLREISGGAYVLPHLDGNDLTRAADVVEKYNDQDIGVADASIVVLAERYSSRTLLTLDRRHFTVVRPLGGGRFTLLP
jgi:uncharacterized protein